MTHTGCLLATIDAEIGKTGPGPKGCGENWAILHSRPRRWTRHSLRTPPRLHPTNEDLSVGTPGSGVAANLKALSRQAAGPWHLWPNSFARRLYPRVALFGNREQNAIFCRARVTRAGAALEWNSACRSRNPTNTRLRKVSGKVLTVTKAELNERIKGGTGGAETDTRFPGFCRPNQASLDRRITHLAGQFCMGQPLP